MVTGRGMHSEEWEGDGGRGCTDLERRLLRQVHEENAGHKCHSLTVANLTRAARTSGHGDSGVRWRGGVTGAKNRTGVLERN